MDQVLIPGRLRVQRRVTTRIKRYLSSDQFEFRVNVGQTVSPKDILGQSQDQGQLKQLASGVYGVVDQLDQQSGVFGIRTQALVIHGVLGKGKQQSGPLLLVGGKDTVVDEQQIDQGVSGKIIVAGAILTSAAWTKAKQVGVLGVITGGVNATDFKDLTGDGLTVVITEGFGRLSIGEDIFKQLQGNKEQLVIIDGDLQQIVIPHLDEGSLAEVQKTALADADEQPHGLSQVPLQVGLQVRITLGPNLATQGKVLAVDKAPTLLPSGWQATMVTVETTSSKIRIPAENLEAVGII